GEHRLPLQQGLRRRPHRLHSLDLPIKDTVRGKSKDIGRIAYELATGASALGIQESIYIDSIRRRNGQFGEEFRHHDKIAAALPVGLIVACGSRLLRRLPGSSANPAG